MSDFSSMWNDPKSSKSIENRIDFMNTRRRRPIIILVDTSESMRGYEGLLKSTIVKLYDEILSDRTARASVELSILSFNDDIEILEPLREIGRHEARGRDLDFHCHGGALIGLALKTAISQLNYRLQAYRAHIPTIRHYAPTIFFISDGKSKYCDDGVIPYENQAMIEVKKYIRKEVADNRLVVVSVEVGDSVNHSLMTELTGRTDDEFVEHVNDFIHTLKYFTISTS